MHNNRFCLNNKIFNSIEKHIDFSALNIIYVGFSGGADSTALLVLLEEISAKYKFKLTAVHFEHGLRGKESINDALWCSDFCKKHKINYLEFQLDVKGSLLSGEGIEACARRLRFEKLASIITLGKDAVALGHHKDDKIENMFLRLIRGSNSSGLTSLRHSTLLKGIKILRPLLDLSKNEIETFLTENSITDWRVDKTNNENLYRRNIIRNKILPELYHSITESKAGILRAEEALKDDAEYLELTSKDIYKELFNSIAEFPKNISAKTLLNMHAAIRVRVLRYWLTDLLGFEFIPNRDLLKRIDSELKRHSIPESILIPLFKDTFLKLDKGSLFLFEPTSQPDLNSEAWNWNINPKIQAGRYFIDAKIAEKIPAKMKNSNDCVYFDYSLLPDTLHIRPWKEGDKFIPFGTDKYIKVKRVFKNEKIAPDIRKHIPLLCMPDNTIIWVAGLKRSNFAGISKSDTKIVFFTVYKKK